MNFLTVSRLMVILLSFTTSEWLFRKHKMIQLLKVLLKDPEFMSELHLIGSPLSQVTNKLETNTLKVLHNSI
jgi:hypothetical protein